MASSAIVGEDFASRRALSGNLGSRLVVAAAGRGLVDAVDAVDIAAGDLPIVELAGCGTAERGCDLALDCLTDRALGFGAGTYFARASTPLIGIHSGIPSCHTMVLNVMLPRASSAAICFSVSSRSSASP